MPSPEHGFAAFALVRVDGEPTARAVLRALTAAAPPPGGIDGLVCSAIEVSLDQTTVVHCTRWRDEAAYRAAPPAGPTGLPDGVADLPGVAGTRVLAGAAAGGIHGPDRTAPPGVSAVAVRHLAGPPAARALLGLLAGSGEWKRDFPGFVSATPYLSPDGTTFVNHPLWVDEAAFRAWMADPRISEGQSEIARLETAPPEYLVCRVAATLT